jgi:hypothetical protein
MAVDESRMSRKIFGTYRDEVKGEKTKLQKEKLYIYTPPNIIKKKR